jgi:hypothetical protein
MEEKNKKEKIKKRKNTNNERSIDLKKTHEVTGFFGEEFIFKSCLCIFSFLFFSS